MVRVHVGVLYQLRVYGYQEPNLRSSLADPRRIGRGFTSSIVPGGCNQIQQRFAIRCNPTFLL